MLEGGSLDGCGTVVVMWSGGFLCIAEGLEASLMLGVLRARLQFAKRGKRKPNGGSGPPVPFGDLNGHVGKRCFHRIRLL